MRRVLFVALLLAPRSGKETRTQLKQGLANRLGRSRRSRNLNLKRISNWGNYPKVEAEIYDGRTSCPLTALSNVQGRFSNGETKDPCQKGVKDSPEPGNFIHIEQEPVIRKNKESWQPVIEALKCAFP